MCKNPTYTYHCHTVRCGHATGSEREMAEAAYISGYKLLGISDHVFLPGVEQRTVRGDISELDEYISTVHGLIEEYKGKMEIHCAFEAEDFGDRYKDYYLDLLFNKGVEYLLLGQHCTFIDNKIRSFFAIKDPHESMIRYTNELIEGMRSGLYLYVCHPDLFVRHAKGNIDEVVISCCDRIIEEALKLDMPLEINLVPVRSKRDETPLGEEIKDFSYPTDIFWERAKGKGLKVVVGADAHSPDQLKNSGFDVIQSFLKKHEITLLDHLDLAEYRSKLEKRYSFYVKKG